MRKLFALAVLLAFPMIAHADEIYLATEMATANGYAVSFTQQDGSNCFYPYETFCNLANLPNGNSFTTSFTTAGMFTGEVGVPSALDPWLSFIENFGSGGYNPSAGSYYIDFVSLPEGNGTFVPETFSWPAPEPSTLALLGCGIFLVGLVTFRRHRLADKETS